MKKCSKCGIEKPLSYFYKDAIRKDGLRGPCKTCDIEKSRKYREEFPEKAKAQVRSSKLKTKYSIDLETFNDMLKSQNNKCAICNTEFWDARYTCVDHNHTTGKVRAILCHNCNTGIGHFKESIQRLRAAIEYISHHENQGGQINP